MIGHYLLTLTPEQETRVLTGSFGPHMGNDDFGGGASRCLVMAARGMNGGMRDAYFAAELHCLNDDSPAMRYDYLCARFPTERINAAIRNRILSNQARRTLTPQAEAVPA